MPADTVITIDLVSTAYIYYATLYLIPVHNYILKNFCVTYYWLVHKHILGHLIKHTIFVITDYLALIIICFNGLKEKLNLKTFYLLLVLFRNSFES